MEKHKQLLLDFGEEFRDPVDKTYTAKKKIIQYEDVGGEKPDIKNLYSLYRYLEFVHNIKTSNVSEEEKNFLLISASRHIVFDFGKIAKYYAHASPEMQRLMEQQALVIIDYDDAVENGYTQLAEKFDKMSEEDYITAKMVNSDD
jgi:hypothetical protein